MRVLLTIGALGLSACATSHPDAAMPEPEAASERPAEPDAATPRDPTPAAPDLGSSEAAVASPATPSLPFPIPEAGMWQLPLPTSMCGLIGCPSIATIYAPLPKTLDAIRTLSFEVCRNQFCLAGELADLIQGAPNVAGSSFDYDRDRDVGPRIFVSALQQPDGYRFELEWLFGQDGVAQDGDHYRLELSEPSGATWASVDEVVTYVVTPPHGAQCQPCSRIELRALR